MLIQFNFENFKTYLDETSLDLTATNIGELSSNLIQYKKDEKYLKVISIYGANASGKSNTIEAFSFMRSWVLDSFKHSGDSKEIPQRRFKFSESGKHKKAMFEVFFATDDQEYQYGYRADGKKIYEEWLYKRDFKFKSKYTPIFEREEQKFNLNKELKETRELLKTINERTLFISVLSNLKIKDLNNVSQWFEQTEVISFGDPVFEYLASTSFTESVFEDPISYQRLIGFLTAIDVGIEGLRIEEVMEMPSSINGENEKSCKIFSKHRNMDTNELEEIPLEHESSGTLKIFSLYDYLDKSLKEGRTLFVDEMDAKLHPLLTRYIINLFQREETNPNNAQLIFTTHEVSTLTRELFRRDQIWFVEKDSKGVSSLFSLAEHKINDKKIRKDASYNKDYLGGRYAAIPNLKEYKVDE